MGYPHFPPLQSGNPWVTLHCQRVFERPDRIIPDPIAKGHGSPDGDEEEGDKNTHTNNTWVLVHFSLRYKDQDILDFFYNSKKSGIILLKEEEEEENSRRRRAPPDLVLWLDSGPHELWIKSFCSSSSIE